MLAPEPYFQPRGTPISIYFRLSALSKLGHKVDVVTYPLGQDRRFDNVTLTRVPNIGLHRIKIGPSPAKIPLDLFLLAAALWKTLTRRYDLIFTHEEAGWFGALLSRLWGIPHVYDMHSCLPQQLINYRFTDSPLLIGIFRVLERWVLRSARAVIVICPDLRRMVEEEGFGEKAVLLENICDFEGAELTERQRALLRRSIAPGGEKILVYTGNFQYYQGIPLLLYSVARLVDRPIKLVLVGGKGKELEETRALVREMGLEDKTVFTGQVAPDEVPRYVEVADALVSPRTSGTNTPLKIYSFLKSGKPLVATRLWTHTQVLDDSVALLADPSPERMAESIEAALFSDEGKRRAQAAKEKADREYTEERYLETITRVLRKAVFKGE